MKSDFEIERKLEELGRKVAPGPSIVGEVMRGIETRAAEAARATKSLSQNQCGTGVSPVGFEGFGIGCKSPRHSIVRWRTFRWVVVAAAAAAVVLVVRLWPEASPNNIVWAEVIRQIRSARTARIICHMKRGDLHAGVPQEADHHMYIYVKAPGMVRQEYQAPGREVLAVAVKDGRGLLLLPSRKLASRLPAEQTASVSDNEIEKVLSRLVPFFGGTPPEQVGGVQGIVGSEEGRLVLQGIEQRDGKNLKKYAIESVGQAPGKEGTPRKGDMKAYYRFAPGDHALALITVEAFNDGVWRETTRISVALDVELPDSLFPADPPPGYLLVPEVAMSERMSDEIRQVAVKYYEAAARFPQYRLLAWEVGAKGDPPRCVARAMRDGERWRVDLFEGNDDVPIDADFQTAWEQTEALERRETTLTSQGRVATIRRESEDEGRQVWRADWQWSVRTSRYRLDSLGWLPLPGEKPSMSPLGDRPTEYTLLPEQPERPGLIRLRMATNSRPGELGTRHVKPALLYYWIDPSKDYLCVRWEQYERRAREGQEPWADQSEWTSTEPLGTGESPRKPEDNHGKNEAAEILELDRTEDGRWYPKLVRFTDARISNGQQFPATPRTVRIQLDPSGPIDQKLLEWPPDVPEPKPE